MNFCYECLFYWNAMSIDRKAIQWVANSWLRVVLVIFGLKYIFKMARIFACWFIKFFLAICSVWKVFRESYDVSSWYEMYINGNWRFEFCKFEKIRNRVSWKRAGKECAPIRIVLWSDVIDLGKDGVQIVYKKCKSNCFIWKQSFDEWRALLLILKPLDKYLEEAIDSAFVCHGPF